MACKKNKPIKSIEEVQKPNIVLFLVDDMGWQDTSVPFWTQKTAFNKRYKTPNMERLAAQGMKFTQAYATPICSPTRISLLTGMNAARHRVTNWTLHKNTATDAKDSILSFPRWNVNGLSPKNNIENTVYATPLPQILKDNGYFTLHSGKAHFGAIGTQGENPLNLGFTINIGGHASGAPQSYLGTENFGNLPDKESVWAVPNLEKYYGKDIFLSEALTQEALRILDTVVGKKPFFLYMAHYAVHIPIQADKRYLNNYADLDPTEAKYSSMVEGVDKSLGDIMNFLEKKGIADNTIILFMSDNGGLSAVARGGKPHTHNTPLNSGKGSIYEGGIREPMLLKWSKKVPANSINNNYLIIEDFYPSILEMAGINTVNTVQQIDGKSFMPLLQKDSSQTRALFWHFPNNWGPSGPGIGSFSAIRKGDWKLIYYHKDQSFELFNITKDIGETHNAFDTNLQIAKQLTKELSSYLKSVNAQMPFHKLTGKKIPYPTLK